MFGVSEKRPSSNSKFCIYQSRMARRLPFRIRSLQGHPFLYLFLFGELTARRGSVFNMAILSKWHINSLLFCYPCRSLVSVHSGGMFSKYHTTEASSAAGFYDQSSIRSDWFLLYLVDMRAPRGASYRRFSIVHVLECSLRSQNNFPSTCLKDHCFNQNVLFRRIRMLFQLWRGWLCHIAGFNH
ncbi:hypothetical protein T08_16518 [Trichinella sp. T8]|nr:hypothetical protein T08_16518 [Trichinella sp. T8]